MDVFFNRPFHVRDQSVLGVMRKFGRVAKTTWQVTQITELRCVNRYNLMIACAAKEEMMRIHVTGRDMRCLLSASYA
jgi:hypothetical protein